MPFDLETLRERAKARAAAKEKGDGLDWARALRDRERRRETMTEAQMRAWRTALHDDSPLPGEQGDLV